MCALRLPITPEYPPMEALTADEIPSGTGWQYEPKWDGFRCIAFRDGADVYLQSKSGQPLARYFPDLVEALRELEAKRFVLDGEIVIPVEGGLSFDDLLLRIHPAASRVTTLASSHPASFIAFDLLVDDAARPLVELTLRERRRALRAFVSAHVPRRSTIRLSPATRDRDKATHWLHSETMGLDGVMAKRLDAPYRSGERQDMYKVKRIRTADCVVGGFRYGSKSRAVGSLLLGLYGDDGLLHHVGFTSSMPAAMREALTGELERIVEPPGFTGRAPGGPSRWSTKRSSEWQPLRPELVVEVAYDHFSGGRFRHGTKFLRWRPDKAPHQCSMDQVLPRAKARVRTSRPR